MTIKAQQHKLEAVRQAIERLLAVRGPLEAKVIASVIGKIMALEAALGPVVQLLSRGAKMDLAEAVESFGWKAKLVLSDTARSSLVSLLKDMDFFNDRPFTPRQTQRLSGLSLMIASRTATV